MRKLLLLLGVLLLVGGAWWLRRPADDGKARPAVAAAHARVAPPPARRWALPTMPSAAPRPAAGDDQPPERLTLKDDALRERLDEQIPGRLYAEAAHCYKGGLKSDQRLDMTYRLHVEDGHASVTNLEVTDNTINNRALESCIKERILAARWADAQLPDVDEEGDLFMRVGGFRKYVAPEDIAESNEDGTEPATAR